MVQVRSSKYRHVYGDSTRKDKCYDNIRLTKNAFDSNLVKTNGKYISLNWDASGGGSFAVIPVAEKGKLPDRFPLFDGHKGAVLDTDWNPFDDEMVVSASDDGTIGIWRVPEGFSVHEEYGSLDDCKDIAPVKFLEGHGKKVGHVGFNPVAQNILASTSLDNTVKVWNVESGDVLFTLKHPVFVTSFTWNYDGTKLATVAKDKKIRIWDVRNEKVLSEGKGHAGAKGSRVVWLGDNERILTTGFSLFSDREMALWDTTDIAKGPIGGFRGLDPSSGIVIPHYDPMTSVVYLGGRGDGKIVYYEYADDTLYDLFAYNSTSPQRGLGWAPLRSLDPKDHEVARVYKVHDSMIEPIPFRVPLKNEGFLDNVYTYADAGEPSLTAQDWKNGKTSRPLVKEWKSLYEGKDAKAKEAPVTPPSEAAKKPTEKDSVKSSKKDFEETSKNDAKKESKDIKKDSSTQPETKTKAEPKAEESLKKELPKAVKSEEITALKKAEKQDSYDVLQSDDVKAFLAKNSQNDDDDDEKKTHEPEENTWDDEPKSSESFASKKAPTLESKNGVSSKDSKSGPTKDTKKDEPKTNEATKEQPKKDLSKKVLEKDDKKESKVSSSIPKDSTKALDEAAVATSEAADAAQKASDAAKVSSESVSKAASARSLDGSSNGLKLDEILDKLDAFNLKIDILSKRLEALENKTN